MAVRGLSFAERTAYILKDDPAHPDNIKEAAKKRLAKIKNPSNEDRENATEASIEAAGDPTVFLLGNLSHEDKIYLSDVIGGLEQTRDGNMRMSNKQTLRIFECVKRGLVGWENFLDDKGEAIAFETVPGMSETGKPRKFVSPDCLQRIRLEHMRELSTELLRLNGVTSDLEKKLEGLLQQQSGQLLPDGLAESAENENSDSVDVAPAA
jgi:hypothetical protein